MVILKSEIEHTRSTKVFANHDARYKEHAIRTLSKHVLEVEHLVGVKLGTIESFVSSFFSESDAEVVLASLKEASGSVGVAANAISEPTDVDIETTPAKRRMICRQHLT